MSLSPEDIAAIRAVIREELRTATDAVVAPPAPVAVDPLPFWTRPADLKQKASWDGVYLSRTYDPGEARSRALYGYQYQGGRALTNQNLFAGWDEVEKVKTLDPKTVTTYRNGAYRVLDPDFACYAVLTNLIEWQDRPFSAANFSVYSGETVESFLLSQSLISQGPSGGL